MNYTKAELQEMISKMQAAANAFYPAAANTGHHAFIEFTGLMNEYIKLCEEALRQGIDFTATTIHGSGKALPMQSYHRDYLQEKLQCIYGVSLDHLMQEQPAPSKPARKRGKSKAGGSKGTHFKP